MRAALFALLIAAAPSLAQTPGAAGSGTWNGAPVPWPTLRGRFDRYSVNLGDAPETAWPGGGAYGAISAVTGAVDVPASADDNMHGRVPGIIIAAGVQGLAITESRTAPGVGGYFGTGLGVAGGSVWGINPTVKNFASSAPGGSPAFNGQVNGAEIDVTLHTPGGGWAGSNAVGLNLQGDFASPPDGQLNAVQVATDGAAPWKVAFKVFAGAATYAREVDPASSGPGKSNGIFDLFVVQDAGGRPVPIIQGYDFNGRLVIRPLVDHGAGLSLQDAGGAERVVLDAATGSVRLEGHLRSAGPAPTATACGTGAVAPGSTDLRGRVTVPPGVVRCAVRLALPSEVEPYVVVSGNVPGVAPAITSASAGADAGFVIGLPPGVREPVTVTWQATE